MQFSLKPPKIALPKLALSLTLKPPKMSLPKLALSLTLKPPRMSLPKLSFSLSLKPPKMSLPKLALSLSLKLTPPRMSLPKLALSLKLKPPRISLLFGAETIQTVGSAGYTVHVAYPPQGPFQPDLFLWASFLVYALCYKKWRRSMIKATAGLILFLFTIASLQFTGIWAAVLVSAAALAGAGWGCYEMGRQKREGRPMLKTPGQGRTNIPHQLVSR